MRINSINNNYQQYKMPAFRSQYREYKINKNMEMGLYTWMFRKDLPWTRLPGFELRNFKNKDKVNIIQFAPSDGSETYTKIISLLEENPLEAEKFFPIQAYDINNDIISGANSGFITLEFDDVNYLVKKRINPDKYFENSMKFYSDNIIYKSNPSAYPGLATPFKVNENLRKKVEFKQGDMFKLVENIKDNSNTILMARNSLAYYDDFKIKEFIDKVAKVLKPNSLFLIGMLEQERYGLIDYLERSGFEPIMLNVFRRL